MKAFNLPLHFVQDLLNYSAYDNKVITGLLCWDLDRKNHQSQLNNNALSCENDWLFLYPLICNDKHWLVVRFLEHVVHKIPSDSYLRYLLGTEYIKDRRYEKAGTELTKAISFKPELDIAIFQLGILYILQKRLYLAIQTWAPLNSLTENHALLLFSQGLQCLLKDDYKQSIFLFEEGLSNFQPCPLIKNDIEKILKNLTEQIDTLPSISGQILATMNKN